jgi:hypothetical protein
MPHKTVKDLLSRHKLVEEMIDKQSMTRQDLVETVVQRQHMAELHALLARMEPAELAAYLTIFLRRSVSGLGRD